MDRDGFSSAQEKHLPKAFNRPALRKPELPGLQAALNTPESCPDAFPSNPFEQDGV